MTYTHISKSEHITAEIVTLVHSIVDGWYPSGTIDWFDFLDRVDGARLDDGTRIDLTEDMSATAITRIKGCVRDYRALPR